MDLTIVINTYDMQREVPRTLMSALPPLQKNVTSRDYEIVVIDNGAEPALSLSGIDFAGVDVRLHRVAPEASHPSPVFAINDCVARLARGRFVMICIDGARMFSPYLVRRTLDILERNPNAFTYAGSRHLGRQVQSKAVETGYDQRQEDALLATVAWTKDLDHLFDISVWAGAHKRADPLAQNESNAFAVSAALWAQLGGYNPGFSSPGGGLCNLEIFNRFVDRADAHNVLLWGEATFHQIHGGAATSSDGYFTDSLEEYKKAVGQDYRRPNHRFDVDKGAAYNRKASVGKWHKFGKWYDFGRR